VPNQVANFPIAVWSGVFLLLSAADHLLVALPRVNACYNRHLCHNRNPFRWAEYAGAFGSHLGWNVALLPSCLPAVHVALRPHLNPPAHASRHMYSRSADLHCCRVYRV
jgi:hypothetical protein